MGVSFALATRIVTQGLQNYLSSKPLILSFEVTDSCNANCLHCDKGGIKKNERRLAPEDYANIWRALKAPAVQISGGEPLLREDVVDIVRAIKNRDRLGSKLSFRISQSLASIPTCPIFSLPYLVVVTNGYLLNKDKYLELRDAGTNQFSVSLDFPDERHDKFRKLNGLYRHLENTIPELAGLGFRDIVLNTCITRENFNSIPEVVRKAEEWGVAISFSAYSLLRTGEVGYCISSEEDLQALKEYIQDLVALRRQNPKMIRTSASVLNRTYEFFQNGYMPHCSAGIRFLLISPDGRYRPCAHHQRYYNSPQEVVKQFSRGNRCGRCFVSIRSFSDGSLGKLLSEYAIGGLRGQWKT